jgi:DNA-binding response OmpR family regulator
MKINKRTILIIDDDESYREIFSSALTREGFVVFSAKNGKEGLLMALDEKPDLILLDIGLPDMDGLSLLGDIRKDEWGKDAKVFILTNKSDEAKLSEAIEKKSFVYLVKSDMSIKELVSKIKDNFNN